MADTPTYRARALRSNMTDAERRLWSRLRRKHVNGFRFRRQVPLGPYIVDFVCYGARLVIEVDGGQHAIETAHDRRRDGWLHSQGFRVLRFWNNDVLRDADAVAEVIARAVEEASHPFPPHHPSPARGEGESCDDSHRVLPPLAGEGEGDG